MEIFSEPASLFEVEDSLVFRGVVRNFHCPILETETEQDEDSVHLLPPWNLLPQYFQYWSPFYKAIIALR